MKKSTFWNRTLVSLVLLVAGLAITMLLVSPSQSEPSEALKPQLTLDPSGSVKQGEPLVVRLKCDQALGDKISTRLGTLKGTLFKTDEGLYEGLFGVPVDYKTGAQTLQVLSATGDILAQAPVSVLPGHFRTQNIQISSSKGGLQPIPGELEAVGALKATISPVRYWNKPLLSPTPDCENSPFGVKRYHNGVYTGDYHKGVDLRSPAGRPIRAIADGTVKIATTKFRLHGGTVGIDHGQGLSSIYIHMSQVNVKPGDHVTRGQVVGLVGSTGFATGPHLHWGLYANGVPVDPNYWLSAAKCY